MLASRLLHKIKLYANRSCASLSTIDTIVSKLDSDNFVLIPSSTMKSLLQVNSSSPSFATLWDQTAIQRDEKDKEVYPFKQSMVSYFDHMRRLSPPHQSIEHIDSTTQHDVSNYRVHKAWPVQSDDSPILKQYRTLLFKQILPFFIEESVSNYSAMQTAFRVTHDPGKLCLPLNLLCSLSL